MSDDGSDIEEAHYEITFLDDGKRDKYVRRDGVASVSYENGDRYEGSFLNGKKHGEGKYFFHNGARYEGMYSEGKKHGKGIFINMDGAKYQGQFQHNEKSGKGKYWYINGDVYEGGWKHDVKHGKGVYHVYASKARIEGNWSNNVLMYGTWFFHDGSKYLGTFSKNKPNGNGIFMFANGNRLTGQYVNVAFQQALFRAPSPTQTPPSPLQPQQLTASKLISRLIAKCVLKVDHYDAIYRLKKEIDGCPNFRRITPELPIFGVGQPTLSGWRKLFEYLSNEQGFEKFVSLNLRTDPIVYIKENSFAPRDKHNIHHNLLQQTNKQQHIAQQQHHSDSSSSSPTLTPTPLSSSDLTSLETLLLKKVKKDLIHRGGVYSYLKETYEDYLYDQQFMEFHDTVKLKSEDGEEEEEEEEEDNDEEKDEADKNRSVNAAVKSIAQMYELMSEDNIEVQYVRVPITDDAALHSADFDGLYFQLRRSLSNIGSDPQSNGNTALILNDGIGKGRVTLAAIIAILYHKIITQQQQKQQNQQENENGSQGGDEDEDGEMESEEGDGEGEGRMNGNENGNENGGRSADIEIPEYDESDPNYKLGQYQLIMKLVKTIPNGEVIKVEVDEAIDRCKSMQNVRECIYYSKEMYEKERLSNQHDEQSKQQRMNHWHQLATSYIERYFYLILYYYYMKTMYHKSDNEEQEQQEESEDGEGQGQPKDYEYQITFTDWLKEKQSYLDLLANLSQFRWT